MSETYLYRDKMFDDFRDPTAKILDDLKKVTDQTIAIPKLSVNLAAYDPDSTGISDSLGSLTKAIEASNLMSKVTASPVAIELPPGVYRFVKTKDIAIPSLVCRGGTATIVVEDPYAFTLSSNFVLSNVKILSKNTYAKTIGTFKPIFKALNDTDNVTFDNVTFDSQLSTMDGSVRASQCVNLKAVTNLTLNNIVVKGYRHGFTADGLSKNIKGTKLHFENVELPLYVRGSSPAVTDENYAYNIQFSIVSHVNTQAQMNNYYKQAGADTFLMEKCDTVTITDVIATYPVERTAYLSCCRNAVVDTWNLRNALGIKFVGGSNTTTPVETIAKNCKVSNVHAVFDDATMTQQGYVAEFYWAKDWSVKSSSITGNGVGSVLVSTMHYIENGLIEDCYGENLKRGFFEYSYVGDIDNPDPTPDIAAGNYTAGVKGLTIRKNTVKNSNTIGGGDGTGYEVIKLRDTAPPASGTYRYQDVLVEDNKIINSTDDYGMSAAGNYCKGLVNIDAIKGLRVVNNTLIGHKRLDANSNLVTLPIQVGANSKDVVVQHEEVSRGYDMKFVWGTLYLSADSKIVVSSTHRNMAIQDIATITVKHDQTNLKLTKDIATAFRIVGRTHIADATDFGLPVFGYGVTGYTLPSLYGSVDVITDNGDSGGYMITKAGVINLKAGSSTIFVTSTNTNQFALLKDASLPRYVMRYKTGPSTNFIVSYSVNAV
ncbi:hypothetical protein CPT_Moonbeam69 [Bacillus phage Moonbeam]|uniref:Uncharacterized protein n=1 Tax=Bacillus phage Moonbeam TaxID=1540091 RepID=A0A0A0RNA4_9CAUD|nr:hypothetical protein CPT_Moonbeam69 [Bacillus phage Moonbeam]AIW03467.1 hypothetical protein CPT_Moonbeam69 [Bacillus phage Moonbeam]